MLLIAVLHSISLQGVLYKLFYYCKIHLKRYIRCYFPSIYNDFLILNIFYIKLLCLYVFLGNIESVVSWIVSVTIFSKQSKKSINFYYDQQNILQNTEFILPQPSDHWKTEHYRGSANHGQVDLDSDINRLTSDNLRQFTNVPSQCERLTLTWTWYLLYFNRWSHF